MTDLHEPRSSHPPPAAAFAGKEPALDAYRQLVGAKYRFDLFGDSMLLL